MIVSEFIKFYHKIPKITDMKKSKDKNQKIFELKHGLPVGLASTKKHLLDLPREEDWYSYFNENKIFWVIPCDSIDGSIMGFVLRSYKDKEYSLVKNQDAPQLMYGFGQFSDFKQDEIIILVEGAKDAIYLSQFHPYVLAVLSNGVSARGFAFLRAITDKFIIAFDNDEAGSKTTKKLEWTIKNSDGRSVTMVPHVKDWADYMGVLALSAAAEPS